MILTMRLAEILRRVIERLEATGLTANKASVLAGKPGAIKNLKAAVKSGNRQGVSTATLDALAPVLGVSAQWLLTGLDYDVPADLAEAIAADAAFTLAETQQALAWVLEEMGAPPDEARVLARIVAIGLHTPSPRTGLAKTDEEKRELVALAISPFRNEVR